MGGPCFVLNADGKKELIKSSSATDNFQIVQFEYPINSGMIWQSAEQCYQGQKFEDESIREIMRSTVPKEQESDSQYGMRIWQLGQKFNITQKWDHIKVEVMYLVNCAKYAANPVLQQELLETTKDLPIVGAPSTWQWSKYNGLIQMLIRKHIQNHIDLKSINSLSIPELMSLQLSES